MGIQVNHAYAFIKTRFLSNWIIHQSRAVQGLSIWNAHKAVPGCAWIHWRGLKGGSTVLKKSWEQRSGTFTPNKRDPSEFITFPNAGAAMLNIKATEPSHLKRRGFHRESCRALPSPACSTAQGWPPQHKAQQGTADKFWPRASLITRS